MVFHGCRIPTNRPAFSPPRTRRLDPAFTLLELILVMILISIALAEAAPQLRGFLMGSGLKNATSNLVSATNWARTQAISEGQTYRLLVDSNGYQVECQNPPTVSQNQQNPPAANQNNQPQGFVAMDTPMARRINLPEDIRLSLTRQDNGTGDHIDFFPDGTTEPGTFTLQQQNDGTTRIVCLSPSERFHVEKEEEK